MPWARLDDAMLDNVKVVAAGAAGFAMHVAGILYCARNLTDGMIPAAKVATLLDCRPLRQAPEKIAARLVELGLWHERGGVYEVHDYLAYNPSRAQVERERDRGRTRQERHRVSRRDTAVTDGVTPPASRRESRVNSDGPVPVPLPALSDSGRGEENLSSPRERAPRARDGWPVPRFAVQGHDPLVFLHEWLTGGTAPIAAIARVYDGLVQRGREPRVIYAHAWRYCAEATPAAVVKRGAIPFWLAFGDSFDAWAPGSPAPEARAERGGASDWDAEVRMAQERNDRRRARAIG